MYILEARGLKKRFSGTNRYAVEDFTLSVFEGEIMGLLGESGCGKTTALRLIAGFEKPDEGHLLLNGTEIAGKQTFIPPEKRNVGIVFQDYGLFPHMTVWQNIRYGLWRMPEPQIQKRISEVLRLTRLEGLEKRYPHQLSGGQQQRLALARAIAPRPKILLLDEPFSNIDHPAKERLQHEIRQIIRQSEITLLFVTHDTRDVLNLADRVAVMQEGKVIQIGPPHEIYDRPVNRYVAEFFGPASFVKARIDRQQIVLPFCTITTDRFQTTGLEEITVMLRPESFRRVNRDFPGSFSAMVNHCHYMGSHYRCNLTVGEASNSVSLLADFSDNPPVSGAIIYLIIDPGKMHILHE